MILKMAGFNIGVQTLYIETDNCVTLTAGQMTFWQIKTILNPPLTVCMHLLRGRKSVTVLT